MEQIGQNGTKSYLRFRHQAILGEGLPLMNTFPILGWVQDGDYVAESMG